MPWATSENETVKCYGISLLRFWAQKTVVNHKMDLDRHFMVEGVQVKPLKMPSFPHCSFPVYRHDVLSTFSFMSFINFYQHSQSGNVLCDPARARKRPPKCWLWNSNCVISSRVFYNSTSSLSSKRQSRIWPHQDTQKINLDISWAQGPVASSDLLVEPKQMFLQHCRKKAVLIFRECVRVFQV